MALRYSQASPMVSARKITKPTVTISRVYICASPLNRHFRTFSSPLLSAMSSAPWNNPQTMKVTLAPCHSPVQKKTINWLSHVRTFPLRLPPSGM